MIFKYLPQPNAFTGFFVHLSNLARNLLASHSPTPLLTHGQLEQAALHNVQAG